MRTQEKITTQVCAILFYKETFIELLYESNLDAFRI